MPGHIVILKGAEQRSLAHHIIDKAPVGAIVDVMPPKHSDAQRRLFWAMLGDLSRQKPQGREHTPVVWKAIVMNAAGYEIQFVEGLSGEPFPLGHSIKPLSVEQLSKLIEYMNAYGAEHGVKFHAREYE